MPPRKMRTTSRSSSYRGTSFWKPAGSTYTTTTYPLNSPKFKCVRQECQWRMGSYKNVYSQFTGAGTSTYLSPTTANKWMKYVNSGSQVYKWTNRDFCRHFGSKWAQSSPTTVRRYLQQKFGRTIKDVTRGKGNCWLVATTKTPTTRPFTTYTWK